MITLDKDIVSDELIDKRILVEHLLNIIANIKPFENNFNQVNNKNNKILINKQLIEKVRKDRVGKPHVMPKIDGGIGRIQKLIAAERAREYVLFTVYELEQKINLKKITDEILSGFKLDSSTISEYQRQRIYLEILKFDFKNKKMYELIDNIVPHIS